MARPSGVNLDVDRTEVLEIVVEIIAPFLENLVRVGVDDGHVVEAIYR